jgi:putative flippase GtrA
MPVRGEFARFLVAGAINTVITFALFEALRRVIPYLAAYSIAYASGIALSYVLNAGFVFRRRKTIASALRFPLVYVVQYAMGGGLLWVLVDVAKLNESFALLLVIAASIPVTFLLSRLIVTRHGR